MGISLLDLPVELRLDIYAHVFGEGKVVLDGGNCAKPTYLLPKHAAPVNAACRSSQLLQTCKTVLHEARPVLYESTTFQVSTSAFANTLPVALTDGSPLAPHVRKLVWQLQVDLMKKFYFDDFAVTQTDVANLESVELRCRAENWRDSFCGDLCDRKAFIEGREQMIKYGQQLVGLAHLSGYHAVLVEDRKFLGKGEVRVRFSRMRTTLGPDEILIQ